MDELAEAILGWSGTVAASQEGLRAGRPRRPAGSALHGRPPAFVGLAFPGVSAAAAAGLLAAWVGGDCPVPLDLRLDAGEVQRYAAAQLTVHARPGLWEAVERIPFLSKGHTRQPQPRTAGQSRRAPSLTSHATARFVLRRGAPSLRQVLQPLHTRLTSRPHWPRRSEIELVPNTFYPPQDCGAEPANVFDSQGADRGALVLGSPAPGASSHICSPADKLLLSPAVPYPRTVHEPRNAAGKVWRAHLWSRERQRGR